MDRRSRHRISKIEERISVEFKQRQRWQPLGSEHARCHATGIAAIVLSGQPKVDEPLIQAWARALRHYGIHVKSRLNGTIKLQLLSGFVLKSWDAKRNQQDLPKYLVGPLFGCYSLQEWPWMLVC
jgi:hypothetical protein